LPARSQPITRDTAGGSAQRTVALVEALSNEPRQASLGLLLSGLLLLCVLAAAGVYGVLELTMPTRWSELTDEAPP